MTIEHVIILEITLYFLFIAPILYQIGRLIHSHFKTKRELKKLLSRYNQE